MCAFLPGSLVCETFGSNTFGKYCFIKRKECSEITNSSLTVSGRKIGRIKKSALIFRKYYETQLVACSKRNMLCSLPLYLLLVQGP